MEMERPSLRTQENMSTMKVTEWWPRMNKRNPRSCKSTDDDKNKHEWKKSQRHLSINEIRIIEHDDEDLG